MRVLLVSDFYAPHVGGVELQVEALAGALTERGDQVCVATMWQPDLPAEEMHGEIRLVRLRGLFTRVPWFSSSPAKRYHPPIADPAVALGVRRLVRDFRPDVVQAHGWIAYSCALGLVRSGVPLIVSVNDFGYTCATRTLLLNGRICDGPAAAKCLRHAAQVYGPAKGSVAFAGVFGARDWLARRTRLVRSVSSYVETVVQRDLFRGRAEAGRIVTIPDIVLVEPKSAGSAREDPVLHQVPSVPYILFVGALQPHKGITTLLQAYRRLSPAPPLVLIGIRGSDSPEFPADVTVIENVKHSAVMRAWGSALFGVVPSICADALPGVVREAMSCGIPVVGTRVGGIVDMIEDEVNGLLVVPGDVNGLAAAMQRLVDDPELRGNLGTRAQVDVARYVPDMIGGAFDRLYRQAIVPRGMPLKADQVPERIHIVGGLGTGKTTLARQLGAMLDAPVHHLDDIAREPETGRSRSVDERMELVNEIASSPRWVTDGIHVGWTDVLSRRADMIVWLDQVGWSAALVRVVRRFIAGGLSETRRQRGLRRFFRPRSYARHLSELYRAGREVREFNSAAQPERGHDGGRAATAAQLALYPAKVVHCRSQDDVKSLISGLDRLVRDGRLVAHS